MSATPAIRDFSARPEKRVQRPSDRRGTAAVECAIVIPVLLILLLGIWEIGRLLEVNQLLASAAREGSRLASSGAPEKRVSDQIRTYLRNAGPPSSVAENAQVTYNPAATTAQGNTAYQVAIELPVGDVSWFAGRLVTSSNDRLRAEAVAARE